MINTFASYNMIASDLSQSLKRIESQPMVQRETEYYLENIGQVKTIDEFVNDERLFRYAMKAHGLEDMTYAKAFMVKVLEEGVSDPESFANTLSDKRYLDFAKSYNFAARGENTTTYNPAQKGTIDRFITAVVAGGGDPASEEMMAEINHYLETVPKIDSIEAFLADDRLLNVALVAHGFGGEQVDKGFLHRVLAGGIDNPESLANRQEDERYADLVASFNFARYGEDATTINATQEPITDKYLRQTLEEDAGEKNEGVRLALYFERKAPEIDSYYEILADKALSQVVRTGLGLPDAIVQSDIDRQAALIEEKLDIADFKDPEKLDAFLQRFTTLWEIDNPSANAQPSIAPLFGQSTQMGISADTLLSIAQLKR